MESVNNIFKKGTFGERLNAAIIDGIVLLVITLIVYLIFSKIGSVFDLVLALISVVYGSLFIWRSGRTPGKRFMKLKVVDTVLYEVFLVRG